MNEIHVYRNVTLNLSIIIKLFHSGGQQLGKFTGTRESF